MQREAAWIGYFSQVHQPEAAGAVVVEPVVGSYDTRSGCTTWSARQTYFIQQIP